MSNYRTLRMHGMGDILREHRRSRPHMIAAVDGDVRLNWPEPDARVNRLANVFTALGAAQGERRCWQFIRPPSTASRTPRCCRIRPCCTKA